MAPSSDLPADFLDRALAGPLPAWSETGDLSRMSVESFADAQGIATPHTEGRLRLSGAGVVGSALALDTVGAVCSSFQRVITAIGAALTGATGTRGRLPVEAVANARLSLVAAPGMGSIVLSLAAESPDVASREQRSIAEEPALAVQSVQRLLGLLDLAVGPESANGDAVADALFELGPRSAAALGDLSNVLATAQIDTEVAWSSPDGTRSASLSASGARWLATLVRLRELDETPVEFTGTVHTVSDRRALEVETADGDIQVLQLPGEQPVAGLEQLTVGSLVRVSGVERTAQLVGGGEVRRLTLTTVELLDQP